MKSPSLDKLYIKLEKHILLAQSYTEIKNLTFIIKACRLKPYNFIFQDKNTKLVLFRKWFDEFGNTLNITTNKRIKIIYNDLTLPRDQIICTDLYYGVSINKILKISKMVHLIIGKDEDLYQDYILISYLGIDNYLRSYICMYGEWRPVSPLVLGIKTLSIIGTNLDLKYFRDFSFKKNVTIPCISPKQWLSCLPVAQNFENLMDRQYPVAHSFLCEDK